MPEGGRARPAVWPYTYFLPFIFFDGQRKRSKRKAALNLACGFPNAMAGCGGSVNSSRQVGTQTVRTLLPHPPIALGCVEWDKTKYVVCPCRGERKPGPPGQDALSVIGSIRLWAECFLLGQCCQVLFPAIC